MVYRIIEKKQYLKQCDFLFKENLLKKIQEKKIVIELSFDCVSKQTNKKNEC